MCETMIHTTEKKTVSEKDGNVFLMHCSHRVVVPTTKPTDVEIKFLFSKPKRIYRCMQHAVYQLIQKLIKLDIQSNSSV